MLFRAPSNFNELGFVVGVEPVVIWKVRPQQTPTAGLETQQALEVTTGSAAIPAGRPVPEFRSDPSRPLQRTSFAKTTTASTGR